MAEQIPVANPKASYLQHKDMIDAAVLKVLNSGQYILGSEVERFEHGFSGFTGSKYSIGVANGTDAITLALKACGIQPGDEIITTSHSAVATAAGIELAGGTPVFVDIDASTRCIDPGKVEAAVTKRTRGIVPVHVYGQPADMLSIMEIAGKYDLVVVEDCAQAHGAKIGGRHVGTFGHAGAFSFYPTKNLGCIGDGGAVITDSEIINEKIRALREYGWETRFQSAYPGMNSRLDELQASILNVKLSSLESDCARRVEIAARYTDAIRNTMLQAPFSVMDAVHAMHLYVIETTERASFMEYLSGQNISSALHYPAPIHEQAAYKDRVRIQGRLENTDALYGRIVTLPLYPQMTDEDVERVCNVLKGWKGK